MILRHLCDYYKKCMELYPDEAPALGFEKRTLDYVLTINQDGIFTGEILEDNNCIVACPPSNKSGKKAPANLLYDKAQYMLNFDPDVQDEPCDFCKKIIVMVNELVDLYPQRADFKALQKFYDLREYKQVANNELYKKLKNGKAISFRVIGEEKPVCAFSDELDDYLHRLAKNKQIACCLVSGRKDNICLTFGIVPLGKATKGKIVSFNEERGYDSQGKSQGENAPISIYEEYAYTAALKRLINSEDNSLKIFVKDPKTNKPIIDRILVYWSSAQNKDDIEAIEKPQNMFAHLDKYDPDDVVNVKNFFTDVKKKGIDGEYGEEEYFFLELVPTSKGRIAISFWNKCSIIDFADIVMRHFDAMNLKTYNNITIRYDALSMVNAASPYKKSNGRTEYNRIPNMIDSVFRSIFSGTLYPEVLMKASINRIMAEQNRPDTESDEYWDFERRDAERAAICKAFLYRNYNQTNIKNMLNEEIKDKGYLCGRLFAVLERTQELANHETDNVWKSDLRSKYMNAAMTTPAIVFPAILANSNYYLDKLSNIKYIEDLKQSIIDGLAINEKSNPIEFFPKTLSVVEQGNFFVGYYQQRTIFMNKRKPTEENGIINN